MDHRLFGDRQGRACRTDVALSVTSHKMTVAARDIENLELNASGKADLAKPEANVRLKGMVGGEALDGKAVLSTADGQRAVKDLNLSLGQNQHRGNAGARRKFRSGWDD